MKRAAYLVAVLILLGGCAASDPIQPADGFGAGALERCRITDPPESAIGPDTDPSVEEAPEEERENRASTTQSADETYRYCMQLAGPGGSDDVLQVLAISNQPDRPMAGRELLIYHPGGPGISPAQILSRDRPPVDLGQFVVVAWDGRTSSVTPGSCGPITSEFGLNREASTEDGIATIVEECRRSIAPGDHIGAARAAQELELLRQALEVDRLTLLTHSYGTAIAEAYIRTHGEHVERAVLDAPIALEVTWADRLAAIEAAVTAATEELLRSCVGPGCDASVGVILSAQPSYDALRANLLAADPRVGSGDLTLSPIVLDQATLLALRSDAYWPGFLDAVAAGLAGDATNLWGMGEQQFFDLDRAVYYESVCADLDHPIEASEYLRSDRESLLSAYISDLAPCAGYPSSSEFELPEGIDPVQVLVLASPYDIYAPASLMQAAPDLRSFSLVCTTNRRGHTSYAAPGVASMVNAFLASGVLSDVSDVCTSFAKP